MKKIKIFVIFLKLFILKIQKFLENRHVRNFLPKKKIEQLKEHLNFTISKDTKNYVLLAWLRDFLIKL